MFMLMDIILEDDTFALTTVFYLAARGFAGLLGYHDLHGLLP